MSKLLFILRHRDAPWGCYGSNLSSGLRNSVRFIVEMLDLMGIEAKMVEVPDNNHIDREVYNYRPTHVIIEAFWVVPEKFDILKKLHPKVTWMVRDHSETPFLAMEGMTFGWVAEYMKRGVQVTCNSPRALIDLEAMSVAFGHSSLVSYTPNYYPVHLPVNPGPSFGDDEHHQPPPPDKVLKIGCFGAIRPLKNHMVQAVAALRYAAAIGKRLEFHVNTSRVEGGANPILNNLRGLFDNAPHAILVESPWLEHEDFLALVRQMDICLQVSFSETFNIVSADAVMCNVPIISSTEVPWLGPYAIANPNDSTSIFKQLMAIHGTVDMKNRLLMQVRDLSAYCEKSKEIWFDLFGDGQRNGF
jgi:hypothetical protein